MKRHQYQILGSSAVTAASNGVSLSGTTLQLGHAAAGSGLSDFTANRYLYTAGFNLQIGGTGGNNNYILQGTTGYLGLGITPTQKLHIYSSGNAGIILEGDSGVFMQMARYSTNVVKPRYELYKARGTKANPLVVETGDELGGIRMFGYNGSSFSSVSDILTIAENVTGSTITANLQFGVDTLYTWKILSSSTVFGQTSSALTPTARFTNAWSGSVSFPAMNFTGLPYTGGSTTTTKPLVLIEPTGTASTLWSTSGTMLGINADSTFQGKIFDFKFNNDSKLSTDYLGGTYFSNVIYISPTNNNTINSGYSVASDNEDLWLNYRGYADGIAYFRNTKIGNGKNVLIASFIGSTGATLLSGTIETGAPTTGTAATWKLGTEVATAITVNLNRYIEVEVGGVFRKLVTAD